MFKNTIRRIYDFPGQISNNGSAEPVIPSQAISVKITGIVLGAGHETGND